MRNRNIIIVSFIVLCIAAQSAQSAPIMKVEPSYLDIWPGDEFSINIMVDPDETEILSGQYDLYYNNSLLDVINQTQGTFLSADGGNTIPIVNNISSLPIVYGETRLVDHGITTPGILATINFKVIGNSGNSELHLDNVILIAPAIPPDDIPYEIPDVTIYDGFAVISQPPSPFFISGYINYENGGECNDPKVNITNINTGHEWKTQTDISENYFQITLVHSDDIITGQILQFTAISPDGSLSNTTNHVVSSGDINNGGFCINITLDRACGDVNDDGIINILDVRLLSKYVTNGYSIYEWTGDVNQDKKIDEEDIQLLLSHVFNPVRYPLNCCCN